MPNPALKGPVNAETEGIYRVNYESFIGPNYDDILVMVECYVCHVFSFLKLRSECGKVCL
jgi:hypothetical protein